VKMLCSAVLVFEAVLVLLAIPVVLNSAGVGPWAGWLLAGLAIMCLVAVGGLRRPWGITLGWVLQAWLVLTGFLVAWMFLLGAIFGALWWAAIHYGRKAEASPAPASP